MTDWVAEIERSCPAEVSWASGLDDGPDRSRMHAMFARWVWREINDELPAGASVRSVSYLGPVGCGVGSCPSEDCTTAWEVVDESGATHRIDVPI